jgi:hypothetical protein
MTVTDGPQRSIFLNELRQLLPSAVGKRAPVVSFTQRPNPYATLARSEILSVMFTDGGQCGVFLKQLADNDPAHPSKGRRDRELLVYRHLLKPHVGSLPVPRCLASHWNDASMTGWLALEYVDAWPLQHHALECWYAAARSLARLHVHFARRMGRLKAADYLLRLDGTYVRRWFDRAVNVAQGRDARLGDAMAHVASHGASVAALLWRHAQTLVHNDLAPKNVMAIGADPPKVWIVDWEMGGIGCGLLDLVQLKDGLPPDADRLMRQAYCNELEAAAFLPKDPAEMDRLFAACEAFIVSYRVARSAPWQLPVKTIEAWIDRAAVAAQRAAGALAGAS